MTLATAPALTRVSSVLLIESPSELIETLTLVVDVADDLEVVGYATEGSAGLSLAQTLGPDVVIVSGQTPGVRGFEAIVKLRQQLPDAVIIYRCADLTSQTVRTAIARGADSCVDKAAGAFALVSEIRRHRS